MITPKSDFIDNLAEVIGAEQTTSFLEALEQEPKSSIRRNSFKDSEGEISGSPIEWCAEGVTLDERFSFTLDPLFHGGCYYVQESSSMFIEPLLQYAIGERTSGLRVLDLCAAPGGKTTHIASLIGKESLLVSNEVIRSRANILKENVIKWGSGNILVTNNDPNAFTALKGFFDIIVVDAPCSGEGMFRKSEKARQEWTPQNVELCRQRQRRILADVWDALAPDGFLLYSTCTFNRHENEEQIEWLEEEMGGTRIDIDLPLFGKVLKSDKGFRFHPDKVEGEGFFISLVQKGEGNNRKEGKRGIKPLPKTAAIPGLTEEAMTFTLFGDTTYMLNTRFAEEAALLLEKLNIIYTGIEVGQVIRGTLKPSHALALYEGLSEEAFPRVEVSLETARQYLRKNDIDPTPFEDGYNIITYRGAPLGFVKKIGTRLNNLYPKESRILHL